MSFISNLIQQEYTKDIFELSNLNKWIFRDAIK